MYQEPDLQDSLHFAQDGDVKVEEIILFSTDGHRAIEVTHEGLEFGGSVAPLYEGGFVTKPVPVMVEGEYKIYDRNTGRYIDVKITREDILEYAKNTPRDVAINYEHRKGQDPVGWLRLADTATCGMFRNKRGEHKFGLLASMELFGEAANKVKRGVYRDGSVELRPVSKEIIGHALTGFPVMRDTQFYGEEPEPVDPVAPATVDPVTLPAETPPSPVDPVEPPVAEDTPNVTPNVTGVIAAPTPQTEEFGEMEPNEILAQALAQYGLKPEDLSALPGLIAATEAEKAKAQLVNARTTVQSFSQDSEGNSYLSGQALEAAAQLYVFGQNNADTELHFGEGDEAVKTNPVGMLELLLKSVKAVQVFGETPGPSAENIIPDVPATTDADSKADEDRVSAITARIKQNMKHVQE